MLIASCPLFTAPCPLFTAPCPLFTAPPPVHFPAICSLTPLPQEPPCARNPDRSSHHCLDVVHALPPRHLLRLHNTARPGVAGENTTLIILQYCTFRWRRWEHVTIMSTTRYEHNVRHVELTDKHVRRNGLITDSIIIKLTHNGLFYLWTYTFIHK